MHRMKIENGTRAWLPQSQSGGLVLKATNPFLPCFFLPTRGDRWFFRRPWSEPPHGTRTFGCERMTVLEFFHVRSERQDH